jgi:predicted alpha/beta-fold hydrolase
MTIHYDPRAMATKRQAARQSEITKYRLMCKLRKSHMPSPLWVMGAMLGGALIANALVA